MNLKKNTKKKEDSNLTKSELKEKNITLKSGTESTTEINTRLSSQNNLKSSLEFKSNNEKKKRRKKRKKQRKCYITQKLLRKCIGLKYQKRRDER